MRDLSGVAIPWGFVWSDRRTWQPFAYSDVYTLGGTIDRYRVARRDGRPITLDGSQAWIGQAEMEGLEALAAAGAKMQLLWADRYDAPYETFSVVFKPDQPFNFERITPTAPFWRGSIFLMEKK